MRIIQIIDVRWYNASADFAVIQARALADAGHSVILLANPGSPPAIKARETGLDVCEKVDFSRANVLKSAAGLKKIAAEFRPEVMFAHRGESHLAAAIVSRKIGVPVARFRGDVRPPRGGVFSRLLNEKYTRGIAVSTSTLANEYRRIYRLDGIPLRIIYPGIDGSRFEFAESKEELKRGFGLNPDSIVIGIIGRFSPVKGHEHFLKAAKIVSEKYPKSQFVIAGGDAQLSSGDLSEKARQLGLDNVKFFGIIDSIERLTSAFDIGIVASVGSEMICRVLMEYYAAGIAVVATRINQVAEVVSVSESGILVPAAEPEEMARAILHICRDNTQRKAISESGRKWVRENRSLRQLAIDTESFLEEVIDA